MSRSLADLLVKDKIITPQQFAEAEPIVKAGGRGFVRYFIEKKYVSETKLLYYLGQKFGLPSINLTKFEVSPDVIKLLPLDIARKAQIIPIQSNKGTLVVAVCDPSSLQVIEELKFRLKMNVEAVLTSYSAFDEAMRKYYGTVAQMGVAVESFQKETEKTRGEPTGIAMELVQVHDVKEGAS